MMIVGAWQVMRKKDIAASTEDENSLTSIEMHM
jgi:hypothetical protein